MISRSRIVRAALLARIDGVEFPVRVQIDACTPVGSSHSTAVRVAGSNWVPCDLGAIEWSCPGCELLPVGRHDALCERCRAREGAR